MCPFPWTIVLPLVCEFVCVFVRDCRAKTKGTSWLLIATLQLQQRPPTLPAKVTRMASTMQLEFSQAMSDFKNMFPDMDRDVIDDDDDALLLQPLPA